MWFYTEFVRIYRFRQNMTSDIAITNFKERRELVLKSFLISFSSSNDYTEKYIRTHRIKIVKTCVWFLTLFIIRLNVFVIIWTLINLNKNKFYNKLYRFHIFLTSHISLCNESTMHINHIYYSLFLTLNFLFQWIQKSLIGLLRTLDVNTLENLGVWLLYITVSSIIYIHQTIA